jgi:hypothetical protein
MVDDLEYMPEWLQGAELFKRRIEGVHIDIFQLSS